MDAPVIIVGAGPAGLSLALGLAHHGVRSIVLDKEDATSTHSRAFGVWPRTLEILRDWGAGDALCDAGTFLPIVAVCDAKNARPLLTIDFTTISDIFANPGALIVPQYDTERVLRERVLAGGACELRLGCEVVGIDQDADGVNVQVRSGGNVATLRAPYVAACDGASSVIREALGIPLDGMNYGIRAVISDEQLEDEDDANAPMIRVAVDRPGLLFALRFAPKTWRVIASVPAGMDDATATSEEEHAKRLRAVFNCERHGRTTHKNLFQLHRRRAQRFVEGRVALVGDAAHLGSPAGGEGMNAAIQDAANLAWKLAYAIAGRGDAALLLASYDAERRQIIADMNDALADRLTKVTMSMRQLVRKAGLRFGARMLRERGMQRKTSRAIGMLSGRYTKSPLIDSRHPLAGRRIDDVTLASGSRINQVRGGKACLVAVGDANLGGLRAIRVIAAPKRWVVKPPVVLIVRPDGVVATVVEKPNRAKIEAAWQRAFAGEKLS
jgi:2-polyprenyl-6-methoxyphenol hydroxylase-like FAD-dependent oxidoreductase